ncbi:hypothetical protein ACHAXS_013656 [Conticribra weissflogii]
MIHENSHFIMKWYVLLTAAFILRSGSSISEAKPWMPLTTLSPLRQFQGVPSGLAQYILLGQPMEISDGSDLELSIKYDARKGHINGSGSSMRSRKISALVRVLQTTNRIRGGESEENRHDDDSKSKRKRKKKRKARSDEEKDETLIQGAKDEKKFLEQSSDGNDALTIDVGRSDTETSQGKRRKRKKKGKEKEKTLIIDSEEGADGAAAEIASTSDKEPQLHPYEGMEQRYTQNEVDATTSLNDGASSQSISGPSKRRRKKRESVMSFFGGLRRENFDDSVDHSQQIKLNSNDGFIAEAELIGNSETSSTATSADDIKDVKLEESTKMNNSPDKGVSDNTTDTSESIAGKERRKKRKRRKLNKQNGESEVEEEGTSGVIDVNLAASTIKNDVSTFDDGESTVTNEHHSANMEVDKEGNESDAYLTRFDESPQDSSIVMTQEAENEFKSSKKRKVRKRKNEKNSFENKKEELGASSPHELSVDTMTEMEINSSSEQETKEDVDGDLVEVTTKDVDIHYAEDLIESIDDSVIVSNEEVTQGDMVEKSGPSVPVDSEGDRSNDTYESIETDTAMVAEVTNISSDDEPATLSCVTFPSVGIQDDQEVEGEESNTSEDNFKLTEENKDEEKEGGTEVFSFGAFNEAEMLDANTEEGVENTFEFNETNTETENDAEPAESTVSAQGFEKDGEEPSTAAIGESYSSQEKRSEIDGSSSPVADECVLDAAGLEISTTSESEMPQKREFNETVAFGEKETDKGANNLHGQDEANKAWDGPENLTNDEVIQVEIAESTTTVEGVENTQDSDKNCDIVAEGRTDNSEEKMGPTIGDEEGEANHDIIHSATFKESSPVEIITGAEKTTTDGCAESNEEIPEKTFDLFTTSFPPGQEEDDAKVNPPPSSASKNHDDILPAHAEGGLNVVSSEESIEDGEEEKVEDEQSTFDCRNLGSVDTRENNISDSDSIENVIMRKAHLHEVSEEQGSTFTTILADEEPVEEFDHDCLTCSVVTWNLAESPPSEKESSFFRKFRKIDGIGSDLVMIGAQECEDIKPRRAEGHRSRHIRRMGIQMLGKDYVPLAIHSLGGIQMALYCHRDVLGNVEMINIADVTCGVGNVFHNKGAIGVYLKMRHHSDIGVTKSSRILFITAHLAAHVKNVDARNDDFKRIVGELEAQAPTRFLRPRRNRDGTSATCDGSHLLNSVDHVFFSGDLNYRVNLPREYVEHCINEIKSCKSEGQSTTALMKKLLRQDQLLQTIASGKAFYGFDEGKITFLPTFKFDKGTASYDTSHKQRVPAWTDRILFKSNRLQVLDYNSVSGAMHSDHRPVYGTFKIGWGLTEQIRKKVGSTKRKKSRSPKTR